MLKLLSACIYGDIPKIPLEPSLRGFFFWKRRFSSFRTSRQGGGKRETETDAMACASRMVFILRTEYDLPYEWACRLALSWGFMYRCMGAAGYHRTDSWPCFGPTLSPLSRPHPPTLFSRENSKIQVAVYFVTEIPFQHASYKTRVIALIVSLCTLYSQYKSLIQHKAYIKGSA